ncbi:glycosyltransferase [Kytococcus sedentarius]|uniref:D-inositol 3-phosphate glycosyltransferase n=1 Tax=Kytococcus sedentarius (strain ATCC 14392 / DSM 20547 / JCM 11482 / CCUG 33030 / NBRC 15357 / NCTC 11040 / CCM 314 / 541) TaxID=478801 RepID=C7NGW3_KYTSD|nr:glycosyltransferase [Kytococcus sedentarius]ACV07635.1 glycosyltransferase [Kytococcus sedentarius DSM 20547]QQB63562.1 glycosyltransferase [Kytococcus sedentarius]STX13514.1 putative glycosyl transferase [Kytococcus sedentarius]
MAARHLTTDSLKLLSVALRAAPSVIARTVLSVPAVPPALRALALDADGRSAEARVQLEKLARTRPAHLLPTVVRVAAVVHAQRAHRTALQRLDAADVQHPARALAHRDAGHRDRALEVLDRTGGLRARWMRERIEGERAAIAARPWEGLTPDPDAPAPRPGVVLHVVTNSLPWVQAGYTLRTLGLTTAQQREGWHPEVATRLGFPVDSGFLPHGTEHTVEGVPHHLLLPGSLPLGDDRALALHVEELTALARRVRPAVLHAHTRFSNAQVALAVGRRLGIPVVYEVRGFLEETWVTRGGDPASENYHRTREAETTCMLAADAVTTLSETMRRVIVERGVPAERVHVLSNAAPADELAAVDDPATAARGRAHRRGLGIGPEEVVLGVISSLNEYEGTEMLVHAFARHCTEHPADPGHLVVVGDGPSGSTVRAAVAALPAEFADRVHLVGRVPHTEVPSWHAAIDLVCVPRLDTPVTRLVTPLKPLSAMAADSPVLVSDLPPLAELVEDGRGEAVPPRVEDWAAAMGRWTRPGPEARAARERSAERAAAWVDRNATWEVVARRSTRLYAMLTNRV